MTASSSADSSRALALLGPTASGKSALALTLAPQLNAEIISVDSGAVYRGMDIGTATPTATMRAQVPHHLIDITDPPHTYNVGRFYRDALEAAAAVRARGKRPLFVGGSMMYFNALFAGLSDRPPVSATTTAAVREEAARQGGLHALYAEVQHANAALARTLPPRDAQRIVRAVALLRSGWQPAADGGNSTPLPMTTLLLLPAGHEQRAQLRQRITARLHTMWEEGLLQETQQLLAQWHLPPQTAALKMAGYRQAVQHLHGEIDAATMREMATTATCQLAKRQLTWMRKWQAESAVLDPFTTSDLPAQALRILQT